MAAESPTAQDLDLSIWSVNADSRSVNTAAYPDAPSTRPIMRREASVAGSLFELCAAPSGDLRGGDDGPVGLSTSLSTSHTRDTLALALEPTGGSPAVRTPGQTDLQMPLSFEMTTPTTNRTAYNSQLPYSSIPCKDTRSNTLVHKPRVSTNVLDGGSVRELPWHLAATAPHQQQQQRQQRLINRGFLQSMSFEDLSSSQTIGLMALESGRLSTASGGGLSTTHSPSFVASHALDMETVFQRSQSAVPFTRHPRRDTCAVKVVPAVDQQHDRKSATSLHAATVLNQRSSSDTLAEANVMAALAAHSQMQAEANQAMRRQFDSFVQTVGDALRSLADSDSKGATRSPSGQPQAVDSCAQVSASNGKVASRSAAAVSRHMTYVGSHPMNFRGFFRRCVISVTRFLLCWVCALRKVARRSLGEHVSAVHPYVR